MLSNAYLQPAMRLPSINKMFFTIARQSTKLFILKEEAIIPKEPQLESNTMTIKKILNAFSSENAKLELLEKLISWSLFAVCACVLQPFYSIVLGTFFLAYLGNSIVVSLKALADGFSSRYHLKIDIPRRVFAFLYMLAFTVGISRFIVLIFPKIGYEAQYFLSVVQSEDPYRVVSDMMRTSLGDLTLNRCENILIALLGDNARKFSGYESKVTDGTLRFGKLLQYAMKGYLQQALQITSNLITQSTSALYKWVLSFIFSTIIIWDLPYLEKAVNSLKNSRIGFLYRNVGPRYIIRKLVSNIQSMLLITYCF
jgi:predicted PurR-regulated permease PerM